MITEKVEFVKTLKENPIIELIGTWLWLSFPVKPEETTRESLKAQGFFWSVKKSKWFYNGRPRKARKASNLTLEQIRYKYGAKVLNEEDQERQAA